MDKKIESLPMAGTSYNQPCCGPPPGPPSRSFELPGYQVCNFVEEFRNTSSISVPMVKSKTGMSDNIGTLKARLGISRDKYRVSPGLYCHGYADHNSPVLVTANYKLSFDNLRKNISGMDVWILVLDTRGVNVWCAAGKNTFSSDEIIRQVKKTGLEKIVEHRQLILPQLGATGISAHEVKSGCGFSVIWGPVRARDVKTFIKNNYDADDEMRVVTFTTSERLVLVPVEISLIVKPSLWALLAIFVISGAGPDIFSFASAWSRGLCMFFGFLTGVFCGTVMVPFLLPWLPFRAFFLKGIVTGLMGCIAIVMYYLNRLSGWELSALSLLIVSVSSFAGMNFTGSTPFTSPSGVEKEMRTGIPIQAGMLLTALIIWVGSAFWS